MEPQLLSRKQVAEHIGEDQETLRNWERHGVIEPARQLDDLKATLRYDAVGLAHAAFVRAARTLGIPYDLLARSAEAFRRRCPSPGWAGWVTVTGAGQVSFGDASDVSTILQAVELLDEGTSAGFVVRLTIPAVQDAGPAPPT